MQTTWRQIELPGPVTCCVPDTDASLTSFVLQEQGDWFEGELAFVRSLAQPGWHCVDVGASYGCYALAMAACSGTTGLVTAIEPHPQQVAALRCSVAKLRGCAPVNVESCAAGATEVDEGLLSDPKDPELAELSPQGVHEVEVRTLDAIVAEAGRPVDLLKIDVEGAGSAVLAGAPGVLADDRTIVQFVIRHAGQHQARTCALLQRSGRIIYRLVPGLGALAPLLPGENLDPFTINAFAIPARQVGPLMERGLLIDVIDESTPIPDSVRVQDAIDSCAKKPWIAPFKPAWQPNAIVPGWEQQRRAVAMCVMADDPLLSRTTRASLLYHALASARKAMSSGVNGSRLFTLARISAAMGFRMEAVRVVESVVQILNSSDEELTRSFAEPFLLPMPLHEELRFESLPGMIRCATLEGVSFLASYSAFFGGVSRLPAFEAICRLPIRSGRSDRILAMLQSMNQKAAPKVLRL
jgi:FkbM family methyltransferase